MASTEYVACTRMYNASDRVTGLWEELIQTASHCCGVALRVERHPFPLDIEELWNRPDLGLAFICGRAFVLGGMRHKPLAVPLRRNAAGAGVPLYNTHILVRDDSPCKTCGDLPIGRTGWTVSHSHSGYLAVKRHLAATLGADAANALASGPGPLHTPANCLKALREGAADAVPLDAYYYDLLRRNAPEALRHTRILESTREYPMPFLAASGTVPAETRAALCRGFMEAAALPVMAPVLEALCVVGFVTPNPADYTVLAEPEEIPCV